MAWLYGPNAAGAYCSQPPVVTRQPSAGERGDPSGAVAPLLPGASRRAPPGRGQRPRSLASEELAQSFNARWRTGPGTRPGPARRRSCSCGSSCHRACGRHGRGARTWRVEAAKAVRRPWPPAAAIRQWRTTLSGAVRCMSTPIATDGCRGQAVEATIMRGDSRAQPGLPGSGAGLFSRSVGWWVGARAAEARRWSARAVGARRRRVSAPPVGGRPV